MAKKKFETALEDLERIVQRLEEADLPLDEALRLFEEGIKLSRLCSQKLEEAEKKVAMLLKDEDGVLSSETFEDTREEEQ